MQSLILSGGLGTRLRPLTLYCPKPLLPIANVPFLSYPMALLRKYNIGETILCTADRLEPYGSLIEEEKKKGTTILCSRETVELGTGGAVKNAEDMIRSDPFFVMNGDILTNFDLTAMLAFHQERGAAVTIALIAVPDPSAFGLVIQDDRGKINKFMEKPQIQITDASERFYINAGVYIFNKDVLNLLSRGQKCSLEKELFPACLEKGLPLFGYRVDPGAYWLDIGTPPKYLEANRDAFKWKADFFPQALPLKKGSRSRLHDKTEMDEATVIGSDCFVDEDCLLSDCVLLDRVTLEKGVTLQNCIIGSDCKIGSHSKIIHSKVIGNRSIVTSYSVL